MTAYEKIAGELVGLIDKQVLRVGDRLPSVRRATRNHHVSPGTVLRAYRELEARGLIESRPRSGYFVRSVLRRQLPLPMRFKAAPRPVAVDVIDLVFEVFETIHRATPVVQFGAPFMNPDLFPLAQMNRA